MPRFFFAFLLLIQAASALDLNALRQDLATAESLVLHVNAKQSEELVVSLSSPGGDFQRTVPVLPGEQWLSLPLATFTRSAVEADWGAVQTLDMDGTAQVVNVHARQPDQALPTKDLLLKIPYSRIHDHEAAYPLRAIVALDEIEGARPAYILQKYLKQMTGIELPIQRTYPEDPANVFLLGPTVAEKAGSIAKDALAEQGYQGFVIAAQGPLPTIAGETMFGTEYGVYRFLREQGFAFYAHGCEVVPQRKDLLALQSANRPFFHIKACHGPMAIGGYTYRYLGDARKAADATGEGNLFDKSLWLDHTSAYLVPPALYHAEHPEYFGSPADTPAARVMLCLTHPDVLRISAERALRWVELQHDRRYFSVSQGDGVDWCDCDRCLAVGNRADQTLHWVNHVARAIGEKYPDKIVITNAYNSAEIAPLNLVPESNVYVFYAAWPSDTSAPNSLRDFSHRTNQVARQHLEGWLAVAPDNMALYDYNGNARYTLYGMADRVKWCAQRNMRGIWYCGTPSSFRKLYVYVHTQLNWNPWQDTARLKNEFIQAYYGDAAPTVRRLFDLIHDRLDLGDYDADMQVGGYPPARFFTYDFTEEVFALFDQALAQAEGKAYEDLAQTKEDFITNCQRLSPGAHGTLTDEQYRTFALNLRHYIDFTLQRKHKKQVAEAQKKGEPVPAFSYQPVADLIWRQARVELDLGNQPEQMPPLLHQLLEHPKATIEKHRQTDFVTHQDNRWHFPGLQFTGGQYIRSYSWQCPPRDNVIVVRGAMTDLAEATASFELNGVDADRPHVLEMEAQDSDKAWADPVPIRLVLNGQTLFEGVNPFPKRDWSRQQWRIPAGLLRSTGNTLRIENLASSDSLYSHWLMVSEAVISPSDMP